MNLNCSKFKQLGPLLVYKKKTWRCGPRFPARSLKLSHHAINRCFWHKSMLALTRNLSRGKVSLWTNTEANSPQDGRMIWVYNWSQNATQENNSMRFQDYLGKRCHWLTKGPAKFVWLLLLYGARGWIQGHGHSRETLLLSYIPDYLAKILI